MPKCQYLNITKVKCMHACNTHGAFGYFDKQEVLNFRDLSDSKPRTHSGILIYKPTLPSTYIVSFPAVSWSPPGRAPPVTSPVPRPSPASASRRLSRNLGGSSCGGRCSRQRRPGPPGSPASLPWPTDGLEAAHPPDLGIQLPSPPPPRHCGCSPCQRPCARCRGRSRSQKTSGRSYGGHILVYSKVGARVSDEN